MAAYKGVSYGLPMAGASFGVAGSTHYDLVWSTESFSALLDGGTCI